MSAKSVTGIGHGSAEKRIAYTSESKNSNVDLGPRVVLAGLLTLDGSGVGRVGLTDFYGKLQAACDSRGCAWIASVDIAVGASYFNGSASYDAISWNVACDDPTFSRSQLNAGTAPKPSCEVVFTGEPSATISYIVTTVGIV